MDIHVQEAERIQPTF